MGTRISAREAMDEEDDADALDEEGQIGEKKNLRRDLDLFKALKSRREGHLELLQQVLSVLTKDGYLKDPDVLGFLQPFLNYVFLQPLSHHENLLAARELHFSLASLVSVNFRMGISLTRLLMHYIYQFTLQTPKEVDWKVAALRELLDAFETLVMQTSLEAEVDNCKQIVSDIQALLIDTCYESKKQGLSLLPILEFLGRIVKLQRILETTMFWRQKILILGHLLAMTDLKEEQLALIGLARKVLRKTNQEGMDILIDCTHAFPSALLWVFPTTNIIASSCASLKNTGASLLQDLEDLLACYWSQPKTDVVLELPVCLTSSYGQLADNLESVLLHLWSNTSTRHGTCYLLVFPTSLQSLPWRRVQRETFSIQSPAASLLLKCYKRRTSQGSQSSTKRMLQAWEDHFEQQFTEIADSMNLQGNLILALLYLDPWYSFINEWLKEESDGNVSYPAISTATFQLMKVLRKISREAIPRVAENAILALAVLYQISGETLEGVDESIITYLKSCLAQNNHEYLQWTSAVGLGYASRYCNTADWRLKLEVSICLLECLLKSNRDIVRGACSMGLGFLFQNDGCKLGRGDTEGMVQQKESGIHALIFQNILNCLQICCPEMTESLREVRRHTAEFASSRLDILWSPQTIKPFEKVEESTWTVAGLAMALGSSVVAFNQIGALESLSHVTKFLIEGIHCYRARPGKDCFSSLALGSFISLPLCVGTCLRLELLTEELDSLLQDIKGLLTLGKSDENFPAEIRMAACIGSGNLLATLLCHGTYRVLREDIHSLVESMNFIAANNNSVLSSLGGFMGLANALGAEAASMMPQQNYKRVKLKAMPEIDAEVESLSVCTPLLFESSCKNLVQNLAQDLLNSALQGSSDVMSNAWWSLALVRRAFIKDSDDDWGVSSFGDSRSPRISLTSLTKESSLFMLCSWLLNIGKNLVDSSFPYHTVASVLRCLKEAPQLPYLDWGTLLRQILHKAASSKECADTKCKNVVTMDQCCKECVLFSLAHAYALPNLQIFLDELCDLSRLISVRTSVSAALILHMTELSSIFSRSRMDKFFLDCVDVTCRASKTQDFKSGFSADVSWQLKPSFWKGLKSLLSPSKEGFTPNIDKDKLFLGAEKCLLLLETPLKEPENRHHKLEEWSAALECMALASEEWVMRVTEFDWQGPSTNVQDLALAQKAIFIKAQMVARHTLPPSALVKPVKWLCNQDSSCNPDVFQQLLWIVCALKDVAQEEKQQWLLEAIENASFSESPDTSLLFFSLLVSSWCSYAPLLLIDMWATIKLLPFTLPSLLSDEGWRSTSVSVLQRCVVLLYKHTITASDAALWYLKRACIVMRRGLPLTDQLRLVDDLETILEV